MASPSRPLNFSPAAHSPSRKEPASRDRGSWSRSGCLTCKKRRKKCDERKPKCGNCIRLGRDCEGYATLWITPMSTSTATFQQGISKSKRQKISGSWDNDKTRQLSLSSSESYQISGNHYESKSFSNSPESVYGVDGGKDISATIVIASKMRNSPEYNDIHRSPSILETSECFYLQYHAESGSQLLSNLEIQRNPLNEVLIPRALSSPLLLNALCTLSACHMSNRASSNQDTLRKAEMTYYGKTLSGVRKALAALPQENATSPAYISSLEELIATVASLCKYEVVRGSVRSWRGHLEALQRLVASCGGLGNLDGDIADWLSGLLIYWQHMANVMRPSLQLRLLFCEGIYQSPKVDLYLGCSEQIVEICSRIADLRRVDDLTLLNREIIEINEYLAGWSCRKESFIIPEGITDAAFQRLELVANCFRYAAFIFLHSTLERMAWPSQQLSPANITATTSTEVATTTTTTYHPTSMAMMMTNTKTMWKPLHSLISFSKASALQNLMDLLHFYPPDNHPEFSALTFPLFIAGCECEGPSGSDQLSSILGALRTLELNFGVHNTRRAQELIEAYWVSRSSGRRQRHWLDLLEDMDWDLLLV